jgi:8-oxo-dGTP pyrophosphatase MutT (NUDIX family)
MFELKRKHMNLKDLVDRLQIRLKNELPGAKAHEQMRAVPTGNLKPIFDHKLSPKPGGVLILLYEENGILKFPLIKRPVYVGAHSGQISLPGGKCEHGEDGIQAALREAEEEIGIERSLVQIAGTLSNFFVMPSNFIITPVIGVIYQHPAFKPDAFEVDKILIATLADIIREDAIKKKNIIAAGQFEMNAPHFEIESEIVWGATAMMLNEFRVVINEI